MTEDQLWQEQAEQAFLAYLDMLQDEGQPSSRKEFISQYPHQVQTFLRQLFDRAKELTRMRDAYSLRPRETFGDYRLIEELGKGGMGVVWKAEQISVGRKVALKLLQPNVLLTDTVLQRFQREALLTARLEHPAIVTVFAVEARADCPFIVEELVENGRTLAHHLEEIRRMPKLPPNYFQATAEMFLEVADAFDQVHREGVIHRDIKPGNLLMTPKNKLKIADFGLAFEDQAIPLSATDTFAGTPHYLSPEQISGRSQDLDPRTDVFSLGVTLYEALTLTPAFGTGTRTQILQRISEVDPVEPRKYQAKVPRNLSTICMKAIEKDRRRRYASMDAFASDLRRFLKEEPIQAKPASLTYRGSKWIKRHRAKSVAAALLLVGLPVVAALGQWIVTHWDDVQAQVSDRRTQNAEYWVQEGFLQLGEVQTQAALHSFRRSMEIQPSPEGLMGWIQALLRSQKPDEALDLLNHHCELQNRFPDLIRVKVLIHRAKDQKEVAESIMNERREPSTAAGWFLEGQLLLAEAVQNKEQKDPDTFQAAIRAFQTATYLAESKALYFFQFSRALFLSESEHDLAAPLAAAIQARWPESSYARYHCGLLYDHTEEWEKAKEHYQRSVELNPSFSLGHHNLGVALFHLKQFSEATSAVHRAIDLNPDYAKAYSSLGVILRLQGQWKEAVSAFQEAIRRDPNFSEAYNNLGNTLRDLIKLPESAEALQFYLKLEPNSAIGHNNLGATLRAQGKLDEAQAAIERALEIQPDFAHAHYNLGLIFGEKGMQDKALQAYRKAIQYDAHHADAFNAMGLAWTALGNQTEAMGAFLQAVKVDPNHADAYLNLGIAKGREGSKEEAAEAFQMALQINPKLTTARLNLGNTLEGLGEIKEAQQTYQTAVELDPENP
ncbi:MAG: tetratricopeptide repeat protein [Planctomycetota bacterium]|nr:MAG: tetratricopeptide repeat protein [Planctomycetota bacterium]